MEVPTEFATRLHELFNGRLRIRWSVSQHEYHIEQKVATGFAVAPVRIDEGRDDLIRAKDGYMFVMAIRTGDRMPCKECNYTLAVPLRGTADIKCPYCALKGRTTRVVAGFWPLDDSLLTHLQKIDPLRGASEELAAEADRNNQLLLKSMEDDYANQGLARAEEDYRRIVGIPMVGYSGRDFAA